MDLNQLYHEHQLLQMRASGALSPVERIINHRSAAAVAGRIGRRQRELGAAASIAWTALALMPIKDKSGIDMRASPPAGVLDLFDREETET